MLNITVLLEWNFTADFQSDVLAILTTFQKEFWNNWYTVFKSPDIELLETEIKLGVATLKNDATPNFISVSNSSILGLSNGISFVSEFYLEGG